ncbi:unnamed protein product, partial [Acanthocheilonema viteae]
ANPTSFAFRKILSTMGRNIQRIINTVFVQDDNPLYGRGTLGIFSGVYISYMQNILLLGVIFLRLPWIVGILSLSLTAFAIFLVFTAILCSSFSIAAIATNGSDRLYGGPFTTIAYSLGNRVALVAGVMLCLANCGFTGICLTICVELIQQYILKPTPVEPNLIMRALENGNAKFSSIIGCSLLLLPLFTGSICGINISSMLKSPTKNIPTGIFSCLLTMLFLITILVCSLALGIERHLLLDKYGRGTYPSFPIIFTISNPMVLIVGLMLMSIVAAIQTAKSLLLSIITSHTIPIPRFFYQRTSKRRKLAAIAITAFLILPYLFVNNLDYILVIASSCMLVALIVINIGTIICSTLNFPSFHPTFRFFRSFFAMLGIFACAIMLYGCKPLVGVIVSTIAIMIYVIFPLHRKRFRRDTPYAIVVDIANMLLYSSTKKTNAGLVEEFYSKPRCIVFTRFPAPCDNLLRMAKILSQNRSALCLSLIRDTGDQENIGSEDVRTARQYMDYIDLSGYATQFKYQKISSLHSIASALASCCGLGVFQSNTVMIEYPSEAALSGLPDSLLYHYHMHRVCVQHCNLVVVKGIFPLKIPPVQSNKTIDIWWIIDNGDVLLMVAKMLKKHKIWRKARLRLFVVVDIEDNIKQTEKALVLWLIDNHYLIYKIEFIRADQRARQLNKEILKRSSDAVLVLMNMPEPPVHLERFRKYLNFLNDMSNELKKVLFVRGVDVQSNIDLETSTTKE